MTRPIRHLALAAGTAAATLVAIAAAPPGLGADNASFMLSWLCLLLFGAVLLVGPLHTLRTGRLATNHILRRDLGIWCAATGLAHLALAFEVSMTPAYMQAWVDGSVHWPPPATRRQLYQWAVIGSLVIAALFAVLLLLSNNLALRWLGPKWWKRLQRTSYLAFALTIAHSAAFQLIESRSPWLVAAMILLTLAVVVAQVAGFRRVNAPGRSSSAAARVTR